MRRGVLFRYFLEERKLKLSKVLTGKKKHRAEESACGKPRSIKCTMHSRKQSN